MSVKLIKYRHADMLEPVFMWVMQDTGTQVGDFFMNKEDAEQWMNNVVSAILISNEAIEKAKESSRNV